MRGGINRDKLIFIAEYVLIKFQETIDRGSIIHDIDLRRWALEAKEQVNFATFKAGHWWIWNFKKAHRITSRKITKFKTQSNLQADALIHQNAEEFVTNVKPHIAITGEGSTYNADESGFNLEIHSGRTLTNMGVKTVEATVQSLSSISHSYTIMPIISADGYLLSPLYIVLKETTGSFEPRVEETLFRPANVYIAASKSGKLTTQHFKNWFLEVYLPNTKEKSLLLLDSWTDHCPEQLIELVPKDKQVNILTIPKKTTAFIQPLDVFGFRIWKNFIRSFSDNVILNNYDINLHLRNKIIKLQSLAHNQLSSPRFQNLFKYSWYKSGYLSTRPEKFENPINYCSFKEEKHIPKCSICDKMAFIRCAWCKNYFCFEHFFEQYHYCNNYIE
ncbi:uncharacterized protein LOC114943203 isoform X1 [Nylanderia fulva]|uniref:uncharacterized protein LOC114943203 isoform X1 n=1 Tax=Nylanderia fulva TaxID=613905 RepID=UPI0010FB5181|nr:uncharacterized protein LOC114943203 isoform X1 [Nylanderia fulva]